MKSISSRRAVIAIRCIGFACLVSTAAPAAPRADDDWSWQTYTFKDDLWLASFAGGKKQFDFRLGAGGALSELRDATKHDSELLSPSFKGEVTDRIIQWTAWSESVTHPVEKLPKPEWRFNVTQGGTFANQISPVVEVRWDKPGGIVDVYSHPHEQWKTEQQEHLKGGLSALTRYETLKDGVLKIRRVVRAGEVTVDDKPAKMGRMLLEAWTPFRRSESTFDALALALDDAGKPDWWYHSGENVPRYPQVRVEQTKGYAVVFKAEGEANHDAIGVVYGTHPLQIGSQPAGKDDYYELDSMEWNDGLAVLPRLVLSDVPVGAVIDQTLYIVPRHHLDGELAALLTALSGSIPAPVFYPPGTHFEGELAGIVERLEKNISAEGNRTEHLAAVMNKGEKE